MPDSFRSSKAREMDVLLQRYARVQNYAEKTSTVSMLNEVFPDIRFRHHYLNEYGVYRDGLLVFFRADRVRMPPRGVMHAADIVLKVEADGRAVLIKNRYGVAGDWPGQCDQELLAALGWRIPRKSRWETIGGEEDWI